MNGTGNHKQPSAIKVNVNIFGRPTPIELSVNQILSES